MNLSDITQKTKEFFTNTLSKAKDISQKKSRKDGAKNVIVIDKTGTLKVYSEKEGVKVFDTVDLPVTPFVDEFFDAYRNALDTFVQKYPTLSNGIADIVIPDEFIITDSVNIPIAKKRAMESAFTVAVENLYKNSDKLKANSFPLSQNKQNANYALVAIRSEFINKLCSATNMSKVNVGNITFSSNAVVNAGLDYNAKLRTQSFMIIDIRAEDSSVIFVTKGRTRGFYPLPFGYMSLKRTRILSEDRLFDHASGELIVLNAKEKAKSKQLTTMEENTENRVLVTELDPVTGEETTYYAEAQEEIEVTGKKGRKLPKFMQRPLPETEEGFVYENFRYFIKWSLDLARNNPDITNHGAIEGIYVNMPRQFNFVLDQVNSHEDSHGLPFFTLLDENVSEDDVELVVRGALLSSTYNKVNNF